MRIGCSPFLVGLCVSADVATLRAPESAFGFASVDELAILTRMII